MKLYCAKTKNGEELDYQIRGEIELLVDQLMEPEFDDITDNVRVVVSEIIDRHF